nr:mediator of RNA polymerase II transcription subunit 15-like [Procambarus clarkii]
MSTQHRGLTTNTSKVILYRHGHIRRALVTRLRCLEVARQHRDRARAHSVVLFLADAARRREARGARLARLFTMFKVKPAENAVGVDALHPPTQRTQEQQKQQQQQQQEPTAQANSSTESEMSVGSYQSSSLSQCPAERDALWVSDAPRRQRALSVDVPSEAHPGTPRRRSAPEVVVTHVPLLHDTNYPAEGADQPESNDPQGAEDSSDPSPTHATNLPARLSSPPKDEMPSTHGRLSPTAVPMPSGSPLKMPTRRGSNARPASRMSRLSHSSLARRRSGSSPAPTHQQESIAFTEISAPLEDARPQELSMNFHDAAQDKKTL